MEVQKSLISRRSVAPSYGLAHRGRGLMRGGCPSHGEEGLVCSLKRATSHGLTSRGRGFRRVQSISSLPHKLEVGLVHSGCGLIRGVRSNLWGHTSDRALRGLRRTILRFQSVGESTQLQLLLPLQLLQLLIHATRGWE